MKVLMINTVSGHGSTGSICTDVASVLEKEGHECYIAYGQLFTNYEKSFKIGTKLENHLHNLGSRLFGKQGYFTKRGTNKLITYINEVDPDVIHLHNLHGNYLNLEILFKYLIKVQKPVVWTLHDCWAFTGKCTHYTDVSCVKWQTQCNKCPQLKTYPPSMFFDQSRIMFEDKKKWFTALKKLTIIPVSHWLEGEVKRSFFKNNTIVPIYNWVDHSIFKPCDDNIKDQYGIDTKKFIILGVSASWSSSNNRLKDFISLSKLISNDMQIVLVGQAANKNNIPASIIHIPYVNGKEALAKIYSNANVYVHVSTEDTFGKVIAEALSCGTPAIVYNATACPEIIGEGCGYVVEKRNTTQILDAIFKIKENSKEQYLGACRQQVVENFDFNANISNTIDIYKKSMKRC
jgi:putative colanic acid biosynthesis glycosyltransferase